MSTFILDVAPAKPLVQGSLEPQPEAPPTAKSAPRAEARAAATTEKARATKGKPAAASRAKR